MNIDMSVAMAAPLMPHFKPKMKMEKSGKKVMTENHAKAYRYLTTNSAIATVSSTGKVKAKKAGKCKIYVVGVNGVYKAITVTVN